MRKDTIKFVRRVFVHVNTYWFLFVWFVVLFDGDYGDDDGGIMKMVMITITVFGAATQTRSQVIFWKMYSYIPSKPGSCSIDQIPLDDNNPLGISSCTT